VRHNLQKETVRALQVTFGQLRDQFTPNILASDREMRRRIAYTGRASDWRSAVGIPTGMLL
jgi:hypothetical protein